MSEGKRPRRKRKYRRVRVATGLMLLFAASAFGSVLAQVGLSNICNADNLPDGGITRRSQHASPPPGYHDPDHANPEQGGPVSGQQMRDRGGDGRDSEERGGGWRGGMPPGPGGTGSSSGSQGGRGGSQVGPGGAAAMGGGYGGGWQPGAGGHDENKRDDGEGEQHGNGSPQAGKPDDETCGGCFAALPDDADTRLMDDGDETPPAPLPECGHEICEFTPPGHEGPPKNLIVDQQDCGQDCTPRPPGGHEAGRLGDPHAVPEPGSLLLMAPALLALHRKRRTG